MKILIIATLLVSILTLIILGYLSIVILGLIVDIKADVSSILDFQSKEKAKEVADVMVERGYVLSEAAKELLKLNTGK